MAIFLTVLLLGWVATGAILCEGAIRVPPSARGGAPVPSGFAEAAVRARDGVLLRASYAPNSSGRCVILLHGILDSRAGTLGFAPMFRQSGYAVLAPDSRGHRTSGEALITYGIHESADVLVWTEWLQQQGCRHVFGLGESLGGATLIQAAGRAPLFQAIVAESPFATFPWIARARVAERIPLPPPAPLWTASALFPAGMLYARLRYGLDLEQASPMEAAKQMRTPLLLIHGLAGTRTPPEHSRALQQAYPSAQLWLVEGAPHTGASRVQPGEFQRRVLHFFVTAGSV